MDLNELFESKKFTWLKDFATKIKNSVTKAPIKEENRSFKDVYSSSDYVIDDDFKLIRR